MRRPVPAIHAALVACLATAGACWVPVAASGMDAAIDAPVAPHPDTLVTLALRRAPELAALRDRAAAARERIHSAGSSDDPMLELTLQDAEFPEWTVGDHEMSMLGVELRQPLAAPGKRASKRRAAAAEAVSTEMDRLVAERVIATEVRTLYARLYAADRAAATLALARALLRALQDAAASRYAAGASGLEPQIAAQVALSRLDERGEDLGADRRAIVAQLNRILDRAADASIGAVETLPEVGAPAEFRRSDAAAHASVVRAAAAQVELAASQAAVEKSERRPDFTIGGGYGYRGDLGPVVTFRIDTEIPWRRRSRQAARGRAAELELAASRHELRRARADVDAEFERWTADWQRADAQVRRYRDAILPQSRMALDVARVAYEAGSGSFSNVIVAFGSWLEAQEQLAAREADRFAAHAQLAALTLPPAVAAAEEETP